MGLRCLRLLFVDSIKQMVRELITQGGNDVKAGVQVIYITCTMCTVTCVCVGVYMAPPWPCRFLWGFLVTLCLGGERAGDN